ncbi:hypothetical protein JZ751_020405 [Albula glossodonta]|uniref:Tonsoku-like protein n=1 Tax=Albula glossodonta TaxID=121402 RepID=A0A8T2MSH9_9TELE|nr:hypothetical protein JZ751_020405 [Albula glossodonta]
MTQLSGMVMLGRREVVRPNSPTLEEAVHIHTPQPPPLLQAPAVPLPAPIRITVRVQDRAFLIPVPHSEADSCTVSWLCDQAAQRYYQACGLLPCLSLQKEGALLSPHDLLLAVLHTNEEVLAEVCSWDLPPLPERYKKACQSLATAENRLVLRLCEVQDGSPSVCVSGLSLPPAGLTPLLRALKLQSNLTELRLSGNRLHDDLMPELVSMATTMPRIRLLDLSANQITAEGLKKAASALEGRSHPAFPCLEELVLSVNPLGDSVSEALSCLVSACPLLATLSLQACGFSARFLQQHRLLLERALSGTGHLRSLCLSHNALGSTGFELVLKTMPLHCLTHLYLSAVRSGPADPPVTSRLAPLLAQVSGSLSIAGVPGPVWKPRCDIGRPRDPPDSPERCTEIPDPPRPAGGCTRISGHEQFSEQSRSVIISTDTQPVVVGVAVSLVRGGLVVSSFQAGVAWVRTLVFLTSLNSDDTRSSVKQEVLQELIM